MRLNIILTIIACVLILGITALLQNPLTHAPPVQQVPIEPVAPYEQSGKAAPDFTYTTRAGKSGTLSQLQGKAVVLNFWASWCTPCIAEFPQLVALARALPDDVVILAISTDDDAAAIDRFLQRYGQGTAALQNLIIAHDPEKTITQDIFQTVRLPESILIDRHGIMRDKLIGAVAWDEDPMQAKLRGLAKN